MTRVLVYGISPFRQVTGTAVSRIDCNVYDRELSTQWYKYRSTVFSTRDIILFKEHHRPLRKNFERENGTQFGFLYLKGDSVCSFFPPKKPQVTTWTFHRDIEHLEQVRHLQYSILPPFHSIPPAFCQTPPTPITPLTSSRV